MGASDTIHGQIVLSSSSPRGHGVVDLLQELRLCQMRDIVLNSLQQFRSKLINLLPHPEQIPYDNLRWSGPSGVLGVPAKSALMLT